MVDDRPALQRGVIPSVPAHSLKLALDARLTSRGNAGLSSTIVSSQYFRGDESNQLEPLAGHAVLNASTSYRLLAALEVFVKVENVLDTDYETFGVLGDATPVSPAWSDPRFVSPGAPLGAWAGLSLRLD